MKYLLNAGFDPTKHPTEMALLALAKAIRSSVGFNKKVVFRQVKEMKNKCLWILYIVDGVKCSTFVRASKFARLVIDAKMDLATKDLQEYFQKLTSKYTDCLLTNTPEWLQLDIKVKSLYRRFYVTYHRSMDTWELRTIPSQRFSHAKFQSLHDLINYCSMQGEKFFA